MNEKLSSTKQKAQRLTGSAPRSALRAEPTENHFAFANHTFAQRTRCGLGHVVECHVLNLAAPVADEMVMPHALRIVSSRASLDGHFTHQAGLHQRLKV